MCNRSILVADDDAEDKTIIQEAMDVLNADVELWFAEHGEEAWRLLEQNCEAVGLPCLIVLDLNMPKMNGAQTLRKIKGDPRFNNIPVVIYSTSINALEKQTCLELGAEKYISKPVSFTESLETARSFLHYCSF